MPKKPSVILITGFIFIIASCSRNSDNLITTGSLLDEMADLNRLTSIPHESYRTIQFSSYDRRSTSPTEYTWFSNEDGFGGEPVPGFEAVLKQPDSTGIGEYLICDIQRPGVIQRLWTAAITGKIRFYLDNLKTPVYEGNAADFFWKPLEVLAGITDSASYSETFRQFDATYLPIPFAKKCRIEWIGNIKDPHFYHVGVRVYNRDVEVETFSKSAFGKYVDKLNEINNVFLNPESLNPPTGTALISVSTEIENGEIKELLNLHQPGAIDYLMVKLGAQDYENSLRQSILNIYFDNAEIPQVHVPLGDFFGAAPGLNPYQSLAFSVFPDSSLICRFIMPFKNSCRIEIENRSGEKIMLTSGIITRAYHWKEGESMHFRALWKMAHRITGYNTDSLIKDMNYVDVKGTGRLVGAATYLYNPSPVPTSWGNWWGEGDEKIFIDNESFPSFFGTGSEDYYNYSWSSPKIFSHAYCGQPRNDGPGNRGYVSNFRWHIADDIPFSNRLNFNMELRHHGVVPDLSYGSIVYFYALPAAAADFNKIENYEIRDLPYLSWSPLAYLGSAGFNFIQVENLVVKNDNLIIEKGNYWAEGDILSWTPKHTGEKLLFNIKSDYRKVKTRIGFTLAHSPDGGTISFILNGKPVKFDHKENINLTMQHRSVLDNHFSEQVDLIDGNNELIIEMPDADGIKKARFDFVWLQKK